MEEGKNPNPGHTKNQRIPGKKINKYHWYHTEQHIPQSAESVIGVYNRAAGMFGGKADPFCQIDFQGTNMANHQDQLMLPDRGQTPEFQTCEGNRGCCEPWELFLCFALQQLFCNFSPSLSENLSDDDNIEQSRLLRSKTFSPVLVCSHFGFRMKYRKVKQKHWLIIIQRGNHHYNVM